MFLCSCVAACVFINIILFDYADGYQASSIPNQNQCGLFVYNNCELSNCRCLVGLIGHWKMMALPAGFGMQSSWIGYANVYGFALTLEEFHW